MSNATKTVSAATKYRVAVREIAVENKWVFTQVSTSTDRFEKAGTVIDVHHGPSNLISTAEVATSKGLDVIKGGGKMFAVQAVLTGTPDPEKRRYIRLTDDKVARYESGQGIALIKTMDAVSTPVTVTVERPSSSRKPKAPVTEAPKPAPKPTARAPKTASAASAK